MLRKKLKLILVKFALLFTLTVSILAPTIHNSVNAMADNRPQIVLDYGHIDSERDRGASYNGYNESDFTYQIGEKVRLKLEKDGYKVVLTRPTEKSVTPLSKRVQIANKVNPDFYVSIHTNSCAKENTGTGVETWIDSGGGKAEKLAHDLNKNISKDLNLKNRGVQEHNYYTKYIKSSSMILELGFINNDKDLNKLINEQNTYADSIVNAIKDQYIINK